MKQTKLTENRRPTVRHSGGAQSGNLAQGTRNHRSASGLKDQGQGQGLTSLNHGALFDRKQAIQRRQR